MQKPYSFAANNKTMYYLKVILFGLIVGATMQIAYAWVAPTATPPNGNIGLRQYVSDCNQFAVNGWSSKTECLTDGRWHKVHSHGPSGSLPNADLNNAVSAAADIKVIASFGSIVAPLTCSSLAYNNGHLLCLDAVRYSGSTVDADLMSSDGTKKGLGASVMKTNGILTCANLTQMVQSYSKYYAAIDAGGCGPSINVSAEWFVKY